MWETVKDMRLQDKRQRIELFRQNSTKNHRCLPQKTAVWSYAILAYDKFLPKDAFPLATIIKLIDARANSISFILCNIELQLLQTGLTYFQCCL